MITINEDLEAFANSAREKGYGVDEYHDTGNCGLWLSGLEPPTAERVLNDFPQLDRGDLLVREQDILVSFK